MHPLLFDIKSMGFDELETRISKLNERLVNMRQNRMMAHEAYNQLQLMLDSLLFEKQERLIIQMDQIDKKDESVVLSTDPLPEEIESAKQKIKPKPKQYSII